MSMPMTPGIYNPQRYLGVPPPPPPNAPRRQRRLSPSPGPRRRTSLTRETIRTSQSHNSIYAQRYNNAHQQSTGILRPPRSRTNSRNRVSFAAADEGRRGRSRSRGLSAPPSRSTEFQFIDDRQPQQYQQHQISPSSTNSSFTPPQGHSRRNSSTNVPVPSPKLPFFATPQIRAKLDNGAAAGGRPSRHRRTQSYYDDDSTGSGAGSGSSYNQSKRRSASSAKRRSNSRQRYRTH